MVVVEDGHGYGGGMGAGQERLLLLSPGKRGASREHSADGGREGGRRTRSPVVGQGLG